jgi:hypothetical protein
MNRIKEKEKCLLRRARTPGAWIDIVAHPAHLMTDLLEAGAADHPISSVREKHSGGITE